MSRVSTASKLDLIFARIRCDAPEAPIQILQAFSCVARDEGITAQEVIARVGLSRSATSRLLNQLCDGVGATGSQSPYHWLYSTPDPNDARTKMYFLTPKGKSVLDSWAKFI